jgi:hypothetical protein
MNIIKYILIFFFQLILQLNFGNALYTINFSEDYVTYSIEYSEKPNSDFSKPNFTENNIFEASFLEKVSCRSVSFCDSYTELINSWKVLDDAGDAIPGIVKTNPKNLEKISDHVNKGVHGSEDIATGLGKAADKQKWLDDLGNGVYRNGDKAEYVNPSGNVLKWTDQHPNSINQSINDALKSSNAGKKVEGKVGEFVKNQGKEVEGFGLKIDNSTLGGQAGDIDLLTKNEIIEVKKSYSAWASKPEQVQKFTNSANPQFLNPKNKNPILYIDEPLTSIQKTDILSKIPQEVILVNSLDELKLILK